MSSAAKTVLETSTATHSLKQNVNINYVNIQYSY